MKKPILCTIIFLMTCFASISSGAPAPPQLCYSTTGLSLSIDWTTVHDATGYSLHYAPFPYTGDGSIESLDMGSETDIDFYLWENAAYYIAVTARNDSGKSNYSNIEQFSISSSSTSASMTPCEEDVDPMILDADKDGYTTRSGDCNDHDYDIYPGATEYCYDYIDQDCDGQKDEKGCTVLKFDKLVSFRLMNMDAVDQGFGPFAGVLIERFEFTFNGKNYDIADYLDNESDSNGSKIQTFDEALSALQTALYALIADNLELSHIDLFLASGEDYTVRHPETFNLLSSTKFILATTSDNSLSTKDLWAVINPAPEPMVVTSTRLELALD